jgi:hypothetical protein
MMPARWLGLLAAGLCIVSLTACGDEDPAPTSGAGVIGRAVLTDDTGRPDRPDRGGGVVVVPADAAADLWSQGGQKAEPADLAHAGFRVDGAKVEALGGTVVPVSDDGSFRVAHDGLVMVCRLPASAESGSTRGCAWVDLPKSGALELSFGEAGFRASVD